MKEVRELSYDIEDSLDDFRVRIDDESTKPDGFIGKCKNLLAKTKARRRIAKAIQDLKAQVMEVSERNARYRSSQPVMNTSRMAVDPRALAIFEDASRLVGIDQPKQEIISFLTNEHGCIPSHQPKMVSIVGIGGIGKTTLARQVYEELKDQFQCQAFLSVSRNPDMLKILRTILSQVTSRYYSDTEAGSIQHLLMEISEFLRTKRYLVVIDDVWDVETWNTISCALSNKSCDSVIITTTRRHDVANACCSLYSGWVYQPKPLQEHDSKRLFYNRIFGPGNECPENLKEISDKILKKCGGLPLAIIAVSGLLANKAQNGVHSVTEWDQVQTSIGHGLERDASVEGMMRILSLSYFDLPHHLKACLFYLGVFPEDHRIQKIRLVQLWVSEGFIPAETTCSLYELGEKCFNELVNRNLIIPGGTIQMTGEVVDCLVHDTVLDFIVGKCTEDNFVTVHGIRKLAPSPGINIRRLSLQGETEGAVTLISNQSYATVRSVISSGPPCSLLGCKFLRVLDFTGCPNLESHHLANIGELLQLRYLGLQGTLITELPEQIGELRYLETLDLRDSRLTTLPSIVRLRRLVNLLMPYSIALGKNFNGVIKNFHSLEVLNASLAFIKETEEATVCVEEIGELTKMRYLCITLDGIHEASYMNFIKKLVHSVQRLNKLRALDVRFLFYKHERMIFDRDAGIMPEVEWCSASLRKLVSRICCMSRVPSWMKSLVNMEELELIVQRFDEESLCILGDLPVLLVLDLTIAPKVEDIPSAGKQRLLVSCRYGYRNLRYFNMWHHSSTPPSNIPMLTFEAGSMPKLEHLHLAFNADLTTSSTNGRLDFGLKHLSQLTKVRCHIFGSRLSALRVLAAIEKGLFNHAKRPTCYKTYDLPRGDSSSQERLRPRRRSHSTAHKTQPTLLSVADFSQREDVICASGDKVSVSLPPNPKTNKAAGYSTTDDSTGQAFTAALPLPMDLTFTIRHHGASPASAWKQASSPGPRHGKQRHRSTTRQGVKGASGAPTCHVLTAAPRPRQQTFFTFSAGSSNAEAEQQALACYEPSQHGVHHAQSSPPSSWDFSAFSSLSLDNGSGSSATAVGADSAPGAPASNGLEPRLITDPQQALAAGFTFNAASTNAEQQEPACQEPSQHEKVSHNDSC